VSSRLYTGKDASVPDVKTFKSRQTTVNGFAGCLFIFILASHYKIKAEFTFLAIAQISQKLLPHPGCKVSPFLNRWNVMVQQTIKHTRTWTVNFFIQWPVLSSLCFVQKSFWIINFIGSKGLCTFFEVFDTPHLTFHIFPLSTLMWLTNKLYVEPGTSCIPGTTCLSKCRVK